jgi:hypothetical protein
VFVLEVQRPGIPVFVYEKGKLILYIRQGESSLPADSHDALFWDRETNREVILRTCFIEFRTLYRRISSSFPQYLLGFGFGFPYLEKRMEDGTFYQYLTKQDLFTLLGESATSSGYHPGIYSELFELKFNFDNRSNEPLNLYDRSDWLLQKLNQIQNEKEKKIQEFLNFLFKEGIYISDLETE